MRGLKKTVAILILIAFTYGLFSVYPPVVHAAATPVNVKVVKFEAGKLDIQWDALPGITTVAITYHTPDTNGTTAIPQTVPTSQITGNTAYITGLKSDYIYDIDIKLFDVSSAVTPVGHGMLYYLPKITFYASVPDQNIINIVGGGREIGAKPKLQLKWIMPRAYYSTSNSFVDANADNLLAKMESDLNVVYGDIDERDISSLNFSINISTHYGNLSSGSSQDSILIDWTDPAYSAKVSGSSASTTVAYDPATRYMSLTLLGRSDSNAILPSAGVNELVHASIYPGTVYYMSITPTYKNATGTGAGAYEDVITAGNPGEFNSSLLSGTQKYAFTPTRFQLSKDSANNVYVKIYKINQGSLDLPRLYYHVQAIANPSVQGDWPDKKIMDDSYFLDDFAVTVITDVSVNNEVYYKIVIKSDSQNNDRLESLKLPYTLAADTSRPPVPTNITILQRELVYRTTGGAIEKTTDVTIQWDKPASWDTIKAATTTGESIDFYLAINTSQLESDDLPYPVLEAEGKSYGDFPLKYRIAAYVNSKDIGANGITEVGNKLQYTLKGFELFKGGYWDGTTTTTSGGAIVPNIIPEDFSSTVKPPDYPDFLLPNKVYYLQMFSTKDSNRGVILDSLYFDGDYSVMSDRSVIKSFTTLTSTEMDVPLPSSFRLDVNTAINNSAPPPAKVNNIELLFDKVTVKDWSNYTSNHDPADAVYYDLYMSSSARTDSFIRIGTTETTSGGAVTFTGVNDSLSTSIRAGYFKIHQYQCHE